MLQIKSTFLEKVSISIKDYMLKLSDYKKAYLTITHY